MNDDPLFDELSTEETKPRRGMQFNKSISGVSSQDAKKAAGKDGGKYRTHGRDEQWTFRLPEGTRAEIVEWANDLNLKQVDLKKWIVERGLQALRDGERPEMEIVEVVRIKL